jgi:hypothetical protein
VPPRIHPLVQHANNFDDVRLNCAIEDDMHRVARDTERGRLQWLRARAFVAGRGTVTERMNVVDASDELAKKGQHAREMSHGLDLLKSDIDIVATTLRLRGLAPPAGAASVDNSVAFESSEHE